MIVRVTFGTYKGQLRDIAPEAALAMLQDGRALHPDEELSPLNAEPELELHISPEIHSARGRRRAATR